MSTATIYVRQSQDRHGNELAVSRQEAECRDLCQARGWAVREVVQDNDASATKGFRRPGFERLLTSSPERIVVWHTDRLVRLTRELEKVLDLGVNVHGVTAGDLDLSTPAGRAVAKTITAWSQYEGEQKAERQRAQTRQAREAGIQPMGRSRTFGLNRDGSVNDPEAAEVRKAAEAVLDGASLGGIVRDWNARGVLTTYGNPWIVSTLRRLLLNHRLAGRIVTKAGVDYGPAGPAVIDQETQDRLRAMLTDPRRRARVTERRARYLLTGLVECGRCGQRMYSAVNSGKRLPQPVKIYRCPGCALTRRMAAVEEAVLPLVWEYLGGQDAADLLRVDDLGEARAHLAGLIEQRDGLADLLALGVSRAKVTAQAKALVPLIEDAERAVAAAEGSSPLAPLLGADDIEQAWEAMTLAQRRDAIRALPGVPVVHPLGRGARAGAGHVTMRWE